MNLSVGSPPPTYIFYFSCTHSGVCTRSFIHNCPTYGGGCAICCTCAVCRCFCSSGSYSFGLSLGSLFAISKSYHAYGYQLFLALPLRWY